MLLLIIKKKFPLLLPKNSTITFFSSSSSSASRNLNPSPKSNPIAEFLINSCGFFSSQKAASASTRISKFASLEEAHSVRHFFKHQGFTDTHMRKLISNLPRVLCADVDKTLQPNLQTLRKMGFTETDLQLLITSNPCVLVNPSAIPRLEFWQAFLGTKDLKDLVFIIRRNRNLIGQDIVSGITPKLALLKEYGLCQTTIIFILKRGPTLMARSSKSIEAMLKRAKELGLHLRSSSMFAYGLISLNCLGIDTFKAKMDFFKGFGWSEEEFLNAWKKAPYIICHSEVYIREKMEFLVGRLGCKQSYIVSHPLLLRFSLEKRLMPRHNVIELLKSNKIVRRASLYTVMSLTEKKFLQTIILRYEEQVPKIRDIYIAACGSQMPI